MRTKDHYQKVETIGEDVVYLLHTKLKALEHLNQLRLVNSDGTPYADTGTRYCRYQIGRIKLALKAFEGLE
tara:strand:+ start:140 stop:352 length:213 start_codon:yes stop_codon:yes gene_type:complete